MAELQRMIRAAHEAERANEPLWLATVMRVRGSAYRHPGARLLFGSGRALAGGVSGGCLEQSIVRKGPWLTRERPVCVQYEGGAELGEEADEQRPRGSGCDGIVDVLIERLRRDGPVQPLSAIEACFEQEKRAALVTVFESSVADIPVGARLLLDEAGALTTSLTASPEAASLRAAAEDALGASRARPQLLQGAGFRALLEVLAPPPRLFVFGSGPDALPLVELASQAGFAVTVCDATARPIVRARFATVAELHIGSVESAVSAVAARRTAFAVVMSHDYAVDSQALARLLDSPAVYIGVLGPERRTRRILREQFPEPAQLARRDTSRLRAPVGLDLGAETAEQIALSIVCEMQAVLAGTSAKPLSTLVQQPIHAPSPELELPAALSVPRTGTG